MTRAAAPGVLLLLATFASAQTTTVRDADGFRQAVRTAKPGAKILLAAGEYGGGFYFENVKGESGKPVTIAAADPAHPPEFTGGASAMHFTDACHLELRDVTVKGSTANGLNFDDGGTFDTTSHHLVLRGIRVTDVGARGNEDGLKMSGIQDFRVEDCSFERWGANGSGIDMVGCVRGVIENCRFSHPGGSNGVQMKGASASVSVRRCRFEDAGSRAINIGGSTGLPFFRPPLKEPPFAEARDITVEGNTFTGSDCPVAFVGVDGAVVRYNTIYRPRRWAMRILQETTADGFVPCRNGEFSRNIVVFRSDAWSEGGVNAGSGTEPSSFKFEGNAWFCLDAPARSKPKLPAEEIKGLYGTDPMFEDPEKGDLRVRAASPIRDAGAEALQDSPVVWLDDAKTVKMEFRRIKAGKFTMGAKEGADEKRLPHSVTLTRDFLMQTTEVTQAQFEALMGSNPSKSKGKDLPVEHVTWDECQEFVEKLNVRLAGWVASLPTEAEWEYACGAGSAGRWGSGNDAKQLLDYAWLEPNSGGKTHPVAQKKPNAWGLHDMHGNAWEWCADWYGPFRGDEIDPKGPETGVARCLRGGSWTSLATHARSAHSLWCAPDYRMEEAGFRVLLK
ncbi:MAG: SUMF1/EgtB/PvdO family nonheme iron enzyme [Planctomycetota bacterium]